MWRRWSLLFAVVVLGCGTPSAATESGEHTSGGDLAERCTGSCTAGEICTNGFSWRCVCAEQYDVNCGGAVRAERPPWWGWTCTPLDGTTDRGDGCPFATPEAGSRCPSEGARCEYGDDVCGWSGTAATCSGGAWGLVEYDYPPPP